MKQRNQVPDIFTPDGFVAAQMIVRAVGKADGDDVDKMITALEGWQFVAPKGPQRIRPAGSRDAPADVPGEAHPGERQVTCRRAREAISPGNVQPPVKPFPAARATATATRWQPPPSSRPEHLGLDIGGATIVADVSLEVCRGRVPRDHRPERRRQDVALQPALGPLPADRAGGSSSTGATSPHDPPYRRTQAGLGRTFQISSVFPRLSVLENVAARRRGPASAGAADLAAGGRPPRGGRAGALGPRPRRARRARGACPPARSPTGTSASSSSRSCSPATRA